MSLRQLPPHPGDPRGVQLRVVQLDVRLAGDAPVGVPLGAAEEVRGLYRCEREGLVPCLRVGAQGP
ncbi:putative enantio-pyochelin synthetase F [Streptomyces sp. Tu6071]|nr:putative enantio-pyochelin synthetase F [Streptomyces sp. Tu6071]